MRYCAFLLLTAGVTHAADFYTGQAARLIVGQGTFTAQEVAAQDALQPNKQFAAQAILGGASGVAIANDTLFVVDSNRVGASPNNNRVLVYRGLSSQIPPVSGDLPQGSGRRCPACVGLPDVVLGQPDFTTSDINTGANGMREPTAVASNGTMLAVADTNNNRVLVWNSIPATNGAPADFVLGQPDFKTVSAGTTAAGMRGPQGVWIQGNRFFVADTQNHRVLIWNSLPSKNGQPADLALGQPDLNSGFKPTADVILSPQADNMSNPVSVTSDGVRLYVSDLGHSRVLVWNTIPSGNKAPADFALGQPDLTSFTPNNSTKLCASNGTDSSGNPTYPGHCLATLSFPRFALSDGSRLFVADGGADRVLVYNTLPAASGAPADIVLGQLTAELNMVSDNANPAFTSAADQLRTPMSLAWDGSNLYVGDPYNRRVMVFSVGDQQLVPKVIRNDASLAVYALGSVALSGTIKEADAVTIHIGPTDGGNDYKYTIVKDDTFTIIVNSLVKLINAGDGDPLVFASPNLTLSTVVLTSRKLDEDGNTIEYSVTTSDSAVILASTGGATLAGGGDAAKIGPGSLVTIDIRGQGIVDITAAVPADAQTLPRELAGVKFYVDGIEAPIRSVSPDFIQAQIPFEVNDSTSSNAFLRVRRRSGVTVISSAIAVPIVAQNPGIYTTVRIPPFTDPRPGEVLHSSSYATGTVSVDGTAQAADTASVTIEDRTYTYTVQDGDGLEQIRDGLIALINASDPKVEAFGAGIFTRIRLRARVPGPEGNGITIGGNAATGAQVIITPTNSALCCANLAYSAVTDANPALPGETVVVYGTGLGLVKPDDAQAAAVTGSAYNGPYYNQPVEFVSSLAGGKTANVLYTGLMQGAIGIYEIHLELNSDLPTNPLTQLTIAQDIYVSNIITLSVYNPNPVSP